MDFEKIIQSKEEVVVRRVTHSTTSSKNAIDKSKEMPLRN